DLAKVQRNKLAAAAPRPAQNQPPAPAPAPPPAPTLAGAPASVAPLPLMTEPAGEPKSLAATAAASCTARSARRGNDAVGGPFIPVS
ncbi:hypothetical protein ACI4AF_29330, partial [Klebsiella pneumoniae]|uniref:hypothetical protein n=1 Tax=Klebsiella pneumoniae TaxID=573 RepID=UPI0038543434